MRIDNLDRLVKKIDALRAKAVADERDAAVVVGYTQHYAVYVHEDLEAHHVVGTAKFLEMPARRMAPVLGQIVAKVYQKTKSLKGALLEAGLELQKASQTLVPVDTSALKASAYTALESEYQAASTAAYEKSESIRQAEMKRRGDAAFKRMKVRAAYRS